MSTSPDRVDDPQPWLRAVRGADEAPPADLLAAVAEELVALWSDLASAICRAGRGGWSVECHAVVVRIVMLSRLAGPTSWEWIPEELLANGVYQGVVDAAGLAASDRRAPPAPRWTRRSRGNAQLSQAD
ncbi:MAG TPA: hypothetical protein VMA72_28900 [Streptosporangiaceae bacterium]|nr:hypothetical protein [Streptosporangiaceae bacterium]